MMTEAEILGGLAAHPHEGERWLILADWLEDHQDARAELARLRAPWTEPVALSQRDLDAAAEAHGTSLSACIDRLTARLGPQAVRRPMPRASHLPERAQAWESLSGAP